VTAPVPRIARLVLLPAGARRWLLGATPQLTPNGGVTHGAIVRWQHLILHKSGSEEWAAFQDAFWNEYRDIMFEWHRRRGYEVPRRCLAHARERAFLRRARERARALRRSAHH
jgi:hypothetical protein